MAFKYLNLKKLLQSSGVFRALRHRNYRLFFSGQCISLIGTWMQQIAMSWLVYRLTQSATFLGFISFVGQAPSAFLTPFAGILADRANRRRILALTQTLMMIQAFALAFLTITGHIQVWEIIVLSIFFGLVNAIDIPVRQAFIVEMIEDKADLGNAIALNSSIFNGARLIGPSIAGIAIALVGEGICFLLNGLSYIGIIIALFSMRIQKQTKAKTDSNILQSLKEGLGYAYHFTPIRAVLMLIATVSLMGMPYLILMPVFAEDVLHGGASTLGFLMGAAGLGAFTGAIFLASRKTVVGLGKWIVIASSLFGIGLVIFSLSHYFWLSMVILVFVGFGMMVQVGASNIFIQTVVEDDKRGRVMSLYTMCFIGMAPVGSLLAGSIGDIIGVPTVLRIGGCFCILGSLMFARKLPALRERTRPVYLERGIIPEVALDIKSAAEPYVLPRNNDNDFEDS